MIRNRELTCPRPHKGNELVVRARCTGQADPYLGKRCVPRFRTDERVDVSSDVNDPNLTIPALTHNISDHGCAFWTQQELPRGSVVFVRPFMPSGCGPWMSARVCHCTRGIRGYLVGVAFDGRSVSSGRPIAPSRP